MKLLNTNVLFMEAAMCVVTIFVAWLSGSLIYSGLTEILAERSATKEANKEGKKKIKKE